VDWVSQSDLLFCSMFNLGWLLLCTTASSSFLLTCLTFVLALGVTDSGEVRVGVCWEIHSCREVD
jgi:hypothetical protein